MKKIVGIVVAVGVAIALLFALGPRFHSSASAQDGVSVVRVESATRGTLVEAVASPGEIQPLKKVSISAKVAAPIVELPHKEGDQVNGPGPSTQPSLLVQLDDKDLQAVKRSLAAQQVAQEQQIAVAKQRIEAQKATIRAQRATMADLERDMKRNRSLLETHDVSQSVLDSALTKYDEMVEQISAAEQNLEADKINLKVMDAQLDAARAQVAKADEDISYTRIESPIDGTITSLKAEVGEMVVTGTMNNAGTVILEVADLNRMLMIAHVDESQIDSVRVGQHAIVHIQAYRDQVFEGTVQTVGESKTTDTTDQTKYFEVKILLDLKGRRIRSGLNADVDIETQRHQNVISVPSQAVVGRPLESLPEQIRSSGEIEKGKTFATVVFLAIDGKAVARPVTVGPSDDTHTIVKSGLKEGDPVIAGPYKLLDTLQNGQLVRVEGSGPTSGPTTQPR